MRLFSTLMHHRIFFMLLFSLLMHSSANSRPALTAQQISTNLGPITVYLHQGSSEAPPIVLLHGVYFDHHLWDTLLPQLPADRTLVLLDMPLHGKSQTDIRPKWTLDDCTTMLLEVLDQLDLPPVVGIGHSWGSMTLLRAAHQQPDRFAALGLCNMPLQASSPKKRWQFRFQHTMVPFRKFYTKQAAQSLYDKASLEAQPQLVDHLVRSMGQLSNKALLQTDRAVIMNADDGLSILKQLQVPTLALKGESDYVAKTDAVPYTIVAGGHVSPLEAPDAVLDWLEQVLRL